jgi:hypothetical protein
MSVCVNPSVCIGWVLSTKYGPETEHGERRGRGSQLVSSVFTRAIAGRVRVAVLDLASNLTAKNGGTVEIFNMCVVIAVNSKRRARSARFQNTRQKDSEGTQTWWRGSHSTFSNLFICNSSNGPRMWVIHSEQQ